MPRPHPPYPPEFRRKIIDLVQSGRSVSSVAKEFAVSYQTIANWIKQDGLDSGRRTDGLTSDELEELRRLRRENRILREEKTILKGAAAWFAQETNSTPSKGSGS